MAPVIKISMKLMIICALMLLVRLTQWKSYIAIDCYQVTFILASYMLWPSVRQWLSVCHMLVIKWHCREHFQQTSQDISL